MAFSAADLRKANKGIVGEMERVPSVTKDEAALAEIEKLPTKEAQAFALWERRPFERGSRRTAFFLLYCGVESFSNRDIANFLHDNRAFLVLLSK
ncbi:hypothetical protein COX86_01400 [Candidatus Micrarchaeota archaeon CG_4_10_14_0_2_um_filter_60_11]|nr:MAG: hypothetical protein AUJ16_01340 [Candidatus Micrarchaeota archaeon CG1_02_60_51]PIN96350.1 MAG: hypothetical protein COU39_01635 [Candidatus Micrarchaeota archaeon CG10_big_fil_rev_8_21_14_0_10_60_32]PIO01737.1 MAG: hypothetical protein COT58_03650 [Candidatus Micrarchaeota archaeon CG09_land_8_20_14_0_10_60_16]PIZ91117.1 MAG: hypothetical protein COX86_01400 [Candidatus Micrarchaeota archaeon CG_4_10_14_0_2_um_filter_60_11]